MRALLLAGLLLMSATAGCTGPVPGGEGSGTPAGPAGAAPGTAPATRSTSAAPVTGYTSSAACPPGGCHLDEVLSLKVRVLDDGLREVGVPLPRGARCAEPHEWSIGTGQARNATAELRQVDRGFVLWVVSQGRGEVGASIDMAGRPACDPGKDLWSIDPDPEGEELEVFADGAAMLIVEVREQQGACHNSTLWLGRASPEWSLLPRGHGGNACA